MLLEAEDVGCRGLLVLGYLQLDHPRGACRLGLEEVGLVAGKPYLVLVGELGYGVQLAGLGEADSPSSLLGHSLLVRCHIGIVQLR